MEQGRRLRKLCQDAISFIRTKISFALLRSSVLCLRGCRALKRQIDYVETSIAAGGKAVLIYDNPTWVQNLNVSFLTFSINFGVLLCKSVLHLMRFSLFIYTGTVTDTAMRLCSLQRFGTISSFSYKFAFLNYGPSFPLQTNIVSPRTVPSLKEEERRIRFKKAKLKL